MKFVLFDTWKGTGGLERQIEAWLKDGFKDGDSIISITQSESWDGKDETLHITVIIWYK